MRAREFLTEKAEGAVSDPLAKLKSVISKKIKSLPADKSTEKMLRGIEDMLSHIGVGGTRGRIQSDLDSLDDRDVNKAKSLLAKYIYSLDADPEERASLFSMWKSDKLVNRDILLSPGRHLITAVVNGYAESPIIKELTDDLAKVSALGMGKGEFLLSVFSKGITKLNKGDLSIDGKTIEVKTYDVGGARFYDQEVRPTADFQVAVNNYKAKWIKEISSALNIAVPKTGLKLADMMEFADSLDSSRKEEYYQSAQDIIQNIFPDVDIGNIMQAFKVNNIGLAKQAYAVANLNYYMMTKKDDGVIFLDLRKDPVALIFFRNNEELNEGGFRLHAGTVYPFTNDPRNAYPQIDIVPLKAKMPQETPTVNIPKSSGKKSLKPVVKEPVPVQANKKQSVNKKIEPGVADQLANEPPDNMAAPLKRNSEF